MPYRVIFSPESAEQLRGLGDYIAFRSNSATARRSLGSIVEFCEGLGDMPHRGRARDDLRPGLRTLSFRGRVLIAYAVDSDSVTILAIFYAGQDFESLLATPDR